MKRWALLLCSALSCATGGVLPSGVEYELAYDDNRPAEPTAAAPSSTWEVLVHFRPGQSFHPLRLRALLAQEGHVTWTVYAQDALEQPGEVLATWDRDYGKDMASGPTDGRWVVEDLSSRVSSAQKAVWIGFRGAGRLWSSAIDSENAFIRDNDPARFLKPMPIRKTPMIRLDWIP